MGRAAEPDGMGGTAAPPLDILLAEDSPVNQRVAMDLLELRGHRVEVAASGGAVLDALDRRSFDLVLMDVQMPDVDGLEATRRIRAREAGSGRHTPVVAMTANAMQGDRERCLAAGMDDYLAKPIRAADLYAKVEAFSTPEPGGRAGRPAGGPSPNGAATDPKAVGTLGPFDLPTALERTGGTHEALVEIAVIFREQAPGLMAAIEGAVREGDAEALRRAAHTLKGSAGVLAAGPAADAARRLEEMGRAGRLEGAAEAATVLDGELSSLLAALGRDLV
jgi:CheY-like chemotaxis protein